MTHLTSADDQEFRSRFESGDVSLADFDHRAHLRLAYIYLADHDSDSAYRAMRQALQSFLVHHRIAPSKYHDTMTRAWILAVRHFMDGSENTGSTDAFIDQNPQMLDSRIMMTHYSAELLFSDQARKEFVEPDLDPIPRYRD